MLHKPRAECLRTATRLLRRATTKGPFEVGEGLTASAGVKNVVKCRDDGAQHIRAVMWKSRGCEGGSGPQYSRHRCPQWGRWELVCVCLGAQTCMGLRWCGIPPPPPRGRGGPLKHTHTHKWAADFRQDLCGACGVGSETSPEGKNYSDAAASILK